MNKFRFSLQINELAESKEFKKHSFFYECTVVALRLYEHTLYNRTVAGLRPYTRSPFSLEIAAQAIMKV